MDFALEQVINAPAGSHPLLDAVMTTTATIAEPLFIAIVAAWFIFGWLRREADERRLAVAALFAAGGALLVNQVISHLWDRPRPFISHAGSVHLLVKHSTDASFPSDHAAAAFAIAAILFSAHRRLGASGLALAVLVAYARVYVGDHYPADVAAGAVIGIIAAALALTWLREIPVLGFRVLDGLLIQLRVLPRAL